MWGFRVIHEREMEASRKQLEMTQNMLERMESEMHYWRTRADEERERADRLNDTVMTQNGLPDVTPTVRREKKVREEKLDSIIQARQEELSEMFSDSFDSEDDLNWIDPDLKAAAQGWMDEAKKARSKRQAGLDQVESEG